jgi:ABC-2 type transport system ATP-binding protein
MDEAEHCGRLGIMNQGRLLALDTPSALKRTIVSGEAFDVETDDLIGAIDVIAALPGVERVGLLGDHLHVIAASDHGDTVAVLGAALSAFAGAQISPAEVTLDDVFMVLAGR